MSKIDSKLLFERFKKSGLSQKAFGKQEGISASMVSYYVRKAQEGDGHKAASTIFSPVVINQKKDDHIIITTSSGVTIEIPL